MLLWYLVLHILQVASPALNQRGKIYINKDFYYLNTARIILKCQVLRICSVSHQTEQTAVSSYKEEDRKVRDMRNSQNSENIDDQVTKHLPSQLNNERRETVVKTLSCTEVINLIGESYQVFPSSHWLYSIDLSPVKQSEVLDKDEKMNTQARRGKLKRQDTPINVDNRERAKNDFKNKGISRISHSSFSSGRTSSCDERQHSPRCPIGQGPVLRTSLCAVNSNPSSSASSAPRLLWCRIGTTY